MWQAILNGLSWILETLNNLVGNYGFAIVLFTIVVKLALFPLTLKQQKSMYHTQQIQPELKKLQEKYKDNKEKLNKEMTKLYQEKGVNPLAGCLPMILQMVILIALFQVLRNSTNNPNLNLYFLGIGSIALPPSAYLAAAPVIAIVIPALSGIFAWFSNKTMQLNQPTKEPDKKEEKKDDKKKDNKEDMAEAMQNSNKMMMNFMPIMSAFIAWQMPIALGIYWIMQSAIQVGQNMYVKQHMDNYKAEQEALKEEKIPVKKGKKK